MAYGSGRGQNRCLAQFRVFQPRRRQGNNMMGKIVACLPNRPDAKCENCKRYQVANAQYFVNVKNSKDRACIYVPISLQVKL
jgi:hypothetical protein